MPLWPKIEVSIAITNYRADSMFAPSPWDTGLFCNDVSYWMGASLESTLNCIHCELASKWWMCPGSFADFPFYFYLFKLRRYVLPWNSTDGHKHGQDTLLAGSSVYSNDAPLIQTDSITVSRVDSLESVGIADNFSLSWSSNQITVTHGPWCMPGSFNPRFPSCNF